MSGPKADNRVAIIGAGVGGLAAAIDLACAGLDVVVLERAARSGGKIRTLSPAEAPIDAGPTVFTMRHVFDQLFDDAGANFAEAAPARRADIIARHFWKPDETLDLYADEDASRDAIAAFAGGEAAYGYVRFCTEARSIYETLDSIFMRAQQPNPVELAMRAGLAGLPRLAAIRPFETLWRALGRHFPDPRLRQLFARYATYCGASPFAAPATLMLIAHAEQRGVWLLEGGMISLADAMTELAAKHGVQFRYGCHVEEILIARGRAAGVRLASGESVRAAHVLVNADISALRFGHFGAAAARASTQQRGAQRSLSAVTWMGEVPRASFSLARHSVFFSTDYRAEFQDLFARSRTPQEPTIYVCAQDRDDAGGSARAREAERLFVLANAPAIGDADGEAKEIDAYTERVFARLSAAGLSLSPAQMTARAAPGDFAAMFPATGGALYGEATHGWAAAFQRPNAKTRVPGLYLAGGSVHPGPGVPMAAMSGRLAASRLVRDHSSTRTFRQAAMPGGISTPSARTDPAASS